jgi:acyl-CoA synthetase (AMP-forming)/AMP-acid ligase II
MVFRSTFKDQPIPTDLTITEFVFRNYEKYADRVAFIDAHTNQTMTYKQYKEFIHNIARNLIDNYGLKKGQVIAIMLPNTPFYGPLFHGIATTGAISTLVNPLYTPEELKSQLDDSQARLIVTIPQLLDTCTKASSTQKIFVMDPQFVSHDRFINFFTLLKQPKNNTPVIVKINPKEDVATLPYSSGTTGISKGVMLTHYNMIANIVQIEHADKIEDTEVMVAFLPFYHCYGLLVYLLIAPVMGLKVINMSRFDLVIFLESVQKHRITAVHIVPPIALLFAKEPLLDKYDLSSIQNMTVSAAPLSKQVTQMIQKRYPNIHIRQGYGMTELSPACTTAPSKGNGTTKPGSAGILLPNVELKIVNIEDGVSELGVGEEGEVVVRGPNIMKGYLNNEKATKNMIVDGWLHTGDIGKIDADGELFIVDRLKELIKYKGHQVPPAELEALLLKHDSIADCAVIGVMEDGNEIPKAFVVKRAGHEGLTEQQVMDFVKQHVSPIKQVRAVEFVAAIPKSPAGKILRRLLRKEQLVSKL